MNHRLVVILIALLLIVVGPSTIQTQAQEKVKCDLAPITKTANDFKSTGDNKADLTALLKLADDIHAANIACNGLTFSGRGNKVLGPFVLPKALYKVTATTKGYLIVKAKSVAGSDCKPGDSESLYGLFEGEGNDGAETTLSLEADCRMVLEVSNSTAAWKITFESME